MITDYMLKLNNVVYEIRNVQRSA